MNISRAMVGVPLVCLLTLLFWLTIPVQALRLLIVATMLQLMRWVGVVTIPQE